MSSRVASRAHIRVYLQSCRTLTVPLSVIQSRDSVSASAHEAAYCNHHRGEGQVGAKQGEGGNPPDVLRGAPVIAV